MSNLEKDLSHQQAESGVLQDLLAKKIESWRDRLLDLGNRNALINTRFSERSSSIEFDSPSTEDIWVKLAAESEAGADPMRFPWRRDLVPPPPEWQEYEELLDADEDGTVAGPVLSEKLTSEHASESTVASVLEDREAKEALPEQTNDQPSTKSVEVIEKTGLSTTIVKRKRREWNPPLDECRNSPHRSPNDLLVDLTDKVIDRKLRNLNDYSRLAMSEQGVHVLYVVFGFLKWYESTDSVEERYSPLMLVPVTLSRASTSAPWELTEAEDDALDNLCLRQRLWQDFKLELPPLPDINELEEGGAREEFLNEVREVIEKHERWEVVDKCVLGRFAFPKIAMWKDLGDHKLSVTEHPLCRAIGGDETASGAKSFGPVSAVPSSVELDDTVPPGEVKSILDCDSSQLEAIVAARKGVSFVLDGPPGTGKSQTIANIIADSLSLGRTVLFVSEKISALEVVKQRLEARQLDDFCLECHSDKANRRAVLFELERCLGLPSEVYKDTAPKLDELADQRLRLNEYVRRIHEPREPLGLSAFELFGRVSRLTSRGLAQLTRCKLPDLVKTDRATFDGWMRLLGRAGDVAETIKEHDVHPWRGCKKTVRSLSIHDDIQHHFGILSEQLSRVSALFDPIIGRNLLPPVTANNLSETLSICSLAVMAPRVPLAWFDSPAETAEAVVALLQSQRTRISILGELDSFVDDVEETFPIEAARAVNTRSDDETATVISGLTKPCAGTVRHRLIETRQEIERLGPVMNSLNGLESALSEIYRASGLGALKNAGIFELGQISRAVQLAAAAGPASSHWLTPNYTSQIRSLADKALFFTSKNEALTEQLRDVITADQVSAISEVVQKSSGATVALSRAVELGLTDRKSLENARIGIAAALQFVEEVTTTSLEIAQALGAGVSEGAIKVCSGTAEQLLEALRQVEDAGYFCGSWRDVSVRDPLRRACDDATEDLADAASVRELLSDRLSHRAFRESSSSLATRGAAYASLVKRWFGGFKAFRAEVSELYSGEVPSGVNVAHDMMTLQKYHRRIRDVQDEADELKTHLPDNFIADEPSSWVRLKKAVSAIDQLASTWPEAVAALPAAGNAVSPGELTEPANRLANAVSEYHRLTLETKLDLPLFGAEDNLSTKEVLESRLSDLDTCLQLWEQIEELTLRPILSANELDQLIKAAAKYGKRNADLNTAAERYANWLPERGAPTETATWQAMRDGADALELFLAAGVDSEELRAFWCNNSFRARQEICLTSARRLEDTAAAAQVALDLAGLDTGLLPLNEVGATIGHRMESLQRQLGHLNAVAEKLRDGADISVEDLTILSDRIMEMRASRLKMEQAKRQLDRLGILDVDSGDLDAALWLAQTISDGTLDPLTQAVASDDTIRQLVSEASTGTQAVLSDVDYRESWNFLKTLFDLNSEVSEGYVIGETPLCELAEKLKRLVSQLPRFDLWLKFAGWKQDVLDAGFGTVVDELVAQRYEPENTADVVAVQFYRQLFDRLAETDRALGHFDIDEHERIRERFRFLDRWEVQASASRIRQYQLGRDDRPSTSFLGPESSELGILQKEISKKRKHKPLRRLFAEIPTVLQRLKPCIMMSPLSVSTFLDTNDIRFDVVIFDEASQVFPWDALGAIYRGKQLIVAGDDKQLPPTNFFNRADAESNEDEEDIGDYESILSLCKSIGMPNQRLKWHYRSRREPLIAFSNRHFYDGELVTFPSVYDARGDGVRLEQVPDGKWIDRKNLKEAERVVEMIVEHVRAKPDKSLGVIALNQSQQRAIEDALYDLRREHPEIDALFLAGDYFGDVEERLFIKNLENVQGDERDVIFLSMGYAFNDVGKFSKNFGPINRQNGERRLNVAVTRAREELVVVSSVRAADMDLTTSKSEGAHLLKAYLNYAEKGVDTLGLAMKEFAGEAESPFEEEVAAALIKHGLEPVPQVGCGGFRIDLALKHPERPGEFCLAVECDGATYHSSHTARDRDRIRQSVLENLGWRIVRIWSTDWIRDPDRQIDRVIAEYQAAVAKSPPKYSPPNDSEDGDELEPQYVEKSSGTDTATPRFESIDEVPDSVIQSTATHVLTQAGAMTFDDLVKEISRKLGFRRLGPRIKARIHDQLIQDLDTGQLKRLGERVTTGEQTESPT